jgi:preprotein translocase subunit SecB
MTTPGNGGPPQGPSAQQGQAQPGQAQLGVLGQYIKDFSFENPNAPRSLQPTQTQPAINIQINVQRPADGGDRLRGHADPRRCDSSGTVLFAFDLTFAGVFQSRTCRSALQLIMMSARGCCSFARRDRRDCCA